MSDISIRSFVDSDLAALADLMGELGYPSSLEQMRSRMRKIEQDPDHATIIAENAAAVVGMVGVMIHPSYEHDTPTGRITALIVRPSARGRGVGSRLLTAAEDWARGRGTGRVAITSHFRRKKAHAFYRHHGYEETGKRFVKTWA